MYLLLFSDRVGGLILLAISVFDFFVLSLFFPIRYGIGAGKLRVKMGLIEHSVRLETIERVVPRKGFRFTFGISAALSLDALEVHYRPGRRSAHIVVSPDNQRAFLDALRTSEPALHDHSDGLIRDVQG
ncbi:MAG: PH domain-containing protein [Rhodothermales bacterium]